MAERDLVPRNGQITKYQILVRKPTDNQRLQPAVMLHPVAEGVADDADVVPLLELQRLSGNGRGEDERRDENCQHGRKRLHVDNLWKGEELRISWQAGNR